LFHDALTRAAAAPAATARARSHNVGAAYVQFALAHPTHFRIMLGQDAQRRMRHRALARAAREAYAFVRQVLVEGLGARDVPEAVVLGWWSVVHGLAFLVIDGHLGTRTWEACEPMVRSVLAALDQ